VKRLQDRVALVTGGGQGIGRAIALAFAREGARVAVADQNPETLAECLAALRALGGRAHGIHCDVGVAADCTRAVEETVQQLGGLGILVNAAAWATTGRRSPESVAPTFLLRNLSQKHVLPGQEAEPTPNYPLPRQTRVSSPEQRASSSSAAANAVHSAHSWRIVAREDSGPGHSTDSGAGIARP
jgi:NAD(P)-dependent dehydrogenase (short-subunit alcohol dehydrogenase family)